jgi:hypothetical protein
VIKRDHIAHDFTHELGTGEQGEHEIPEAQFDLLCQIGFETRIHGCVHGCHGDLYLDVESFKMLPFSSAVTRTVRGRVFPSEVRTLPL